MDNSKKKKSKEEKPAIVFDSLPDYLKHVKAEKATEVWVAAVTEPPVKRDVREDMFHAVLSAVPANETSDEKPKKQKPLVYVEQLFFEGQPVSGIDQSALNARDFQVVIETSLALIIAAIEAAGLVARRGSIS